ncbi:uncharacterized protein F5147DRAFT_656210 [Suillus discolor]|uniref:Uncharacterized protein n=1 Tax=Suillus discolor TaxID=1912936 RepID=A0A9P7JQ67_9AGAM|nr:uncharacterized protein F5147DRAFT_656210 [Suillus discolor]KAG2097972.1 hypothetical protein F5147DRAFT_656210 [Suillus discolor]
MTIRHKILNSKTRLMLRDVRPSVQPHVKYTRLFRKRARRSPVLLPIPAVSILIPLYVAAAVLLQHPGYHVHQHPLGPGTSSRRSPPVVDAPTLDDKKALYVTRRP